MMYTIGTWLTHKFGWYGIATVALGIILFSVIAMAQCVWEAGR